MSAQAQVRRLQTLLERVQNRRELHRPRSARRPAEARASRPVAPTPLAQGVRREAEVPAESAPPSARPAPVSAPSSDPPAPSLPPQPVEPEPLELGDLEATGPTPVASAPEVEAISLPSDNAPPLELEQHRGPQEPGVRFEPSIAARGASPVTRTSVAQPVEALTFGGLLELSLSLRPKR